MAYDQQLADVERERNYYFKLCAERSDEIARLRAWISRIDAINDHPGHFNSEIDHACQAAKRGLTIAEAGRTDEQGTQAKGD